MKKLANKKRTPIDISIISLSLMEMLASITIISKIPYFIILTDVVKAINYIFFLFLISRKISRKEYSVRLLLIFGIIELVFLYGYIRSGMSAFLTAWFLIFALKDYDFKKIIADIHYSISIILILTLFFGLISFNDLDSQLQTGFHLGMAQKNILGFYIFEYYITWIFSKKSERHFILVTELTGFFILLFTRCKTAAGLLFVLPLIYWLVQRTMYAKHYKFFVFLIEIFAPILLAFTYVTAILFPISPRVQTMNRFLTNRIFLNWFILSKNRVTLFGQNIKLHYTGIRNEIINQGNISTTVDGTYITMLLLLGLIPTIMFLIGYITLVHKEGVRKDCLLLTITVLLAAYALMETQFTSIFFNFVFFYLTASESDIPKISMSISDSGFAQNKCCRSGCMAEK